MPLRRVTYQALEDIVGPENISADPAVLDSYAREHRIKLYTGSFYAMRYEAIVLPGSTEEVQAIVKACNKYNVKFKARSGGFGWFNAAAEPGTINIDLVRMNRILEINEKNMYAVIEAGVLCAPFAAELNRHGLRGNIIGAGGTTSALPLTADCGQGHTSESTSYNNRNILSVEWVTPEGEVVRFGSLGAGQGWFCGDGPGPSLRGVIRGITDALGGLGVFTKAAVKVYHWPGPPFPEIDGSAPLDTAELPKTIKPFLSYFPSWEQMVDALYEVSESEIASCLNRMGLTLVAHVLTTNRKEELKKISELRQAGLLEPAFVTVIFADSQREFDYKEKVLRQIVTQRGGKFMPIEKETSGAYRLVWGYILRGTRPQGFSTSVHVLHATTLGAMGTLASQMPLLHRSHEVQQKLIKEGVAVDLGVWCLIHMIEHEHYAHVENVCGFSSYTDEVRKAAVEYGEDAIQAMKQQHVGTRLGMGGDSTLNEWGPLCQNFHLWQRKIKQAFDPHLVSDSLFYTTPEGKPLADWDVLHFKAPQK